ncbi:hypothetical protein C8E86_3761 [Catellatospora citrea]|nr:hypothetical protein C8E86_3761 [Catellatospora citrea]
MASSPRFRAPSGDQVQMLGRTQGHWGHLRTRARGAAAPTVGRSAHMPLVLSGSPTRSASALRRRGDAVSRHASCAAHPRTADAGCECRDDAGLRRWVLQRGGRPNSLPRRVRVSLALPAPKTEASAGLAAVPTSAGRSRRLQVYCFTETNNAVSDSICGNPIRAALSTNACSCHAVAAVTSCWATLPAWQLGGADDFEKSTEHRRSTPGNRRPRTCRPEWHPGAVTSVKRACGFGCMAVGPGGAARR